MKPISCQMMSCMIAVEALMLFSSWKMISKKKMISRFYCRSRKEGKLYFLLHITSEISTSMRNTFSTQMTKKDG